MKKYSYEMHLKVHHLRWKYKDNKLLNDALDRILWHSMPIVYSDFYFDVKTRQRELEKHKKQRYRVRSYIRRMMSQSSRLYLATFTFSDEFDVKDSSLKKRYVREWLNANTIDYYACVDFGKEKQREHYHAIISVSFDFFEVFNKRRRYLDLPSDRRWKFGYSSFRLIGDDSSDPFKSLAYALKASNYAFKNSSSVVRPFHKRGGWRSIVDDSIF